MMATAIEIPLLRTSLTYTDVKLDKSAGNYTEWHRCAKHFLILTGLSPYVFGKIPKPAESDKSNLCNWEANDDLAKALILSTLSCIEWDFAEPSKRAHECWEGIVAQHKNEGPMKQIQLIRDALSINFTSI